MRKNRIRLTESQLHGIIKEAIETIVDEGNTNYRYVKGANQIFHKLVVDDSDISVDEQGYLLKQPGNYNLYGTPTQGDFCTTEKPFGNYRDENGNELTNESRLHRIIKESVKNVLNEIGDTIDGQIALGALSARKKGIKGYGDGKLDDICLYAAKQARKSENPSRLTNAYHDSYMASQPSTPDETQKRKRKEISDFYNGLK